MLNRLVYAQWPISRYALPSRPAELAHEQLHPVFTYLLLRFRPANRGPHRGEKAFTSTDRHASCERPALALLYISRSPRPTRDGRIRALQTSWQRARASTTAAAFCAIASPYNRSRFSSAGSPSNSKRAGPPPAGVLLCFADPLFATRARRRHARPPGYSRAGELSRGRTDDTATATTAPSLPQENDSSPSSGEAHATRTAGCTSAGFCGVV